MSGVRKKEEIHRMALYGAGYHSGHSGYFSDDFQDAGKMPCGLPLRQISGPVVGGSGINQVAVTIRTIFKFSSLTDVNPPGY